MKSGIYKILNINNGKFYIGSSKNIYIRWKKHISLLRVNKHPNSYLQNAWNKHKEKSFEFNILEKTRKRKLIKKEQYYLDSLLFAQEFIKGENKKFLTLGYNLSPTASSNLGASYNKENMKGGMFMKKHTKKSKDKIRKGNIGKHNIKHTEKTKNKLSKPIIQYDLEGNKIKEYNSASIASEELGILVSGISQCCNGINKTSCGYKWKHKNINHA